jgi:hypothetical protein
VNPIVAVILGAIVLGEPVEPRTGVAGSVIVFAVALIVTARGRMQSPRAEAVAGPSVRLAEPTAGAAGPSAGPSSQPSAGASAVRPG